MHLFYGSWFGFNAGSEVMVDGITVSAWTVTNTATGYGDSNVGVDVMGTHRQT